MNSYSRCALLLVAGMMLAVGHAAMAAAPNPLTIHSFCAQPSNGTCLDGSNNGGGGLVRGKDGFYYGYTVTGGIQAKGHGHGAGLIYRINGKTGQFSVVYQFDPVLDGYSPSSLKFGSDGNLYGILSGGPTGLGSLYRLSPAGEFTVVHTFVSGENFGAVIEDAQGNWYGGSGGGAFNMGSIYEVSKDGVYSVLHSFDGSDGSTPNQLLLLAGDGNFYGTTTEINSGTVFRMTADGTVTTLHTFNNSATEGWQPIALTTGADGALYGMTVYGGPNGQGTIFRMTLGGDFSVLHAFSEPDHPGSLYLYPLTLMSDGKLYGVSLYGGDTDDGMIFSITSTGDYARVYSFADVGASGFFPCASLVRGFDKALYGVTAAGGRYPHVGNNNGIAFRYAPPPVQ